ncbi:alpha/beta hydrolase [Paraburkholderia megapolitana]|uniref:alpha/beta hydrolase n=1 Tax=Paraburkholderia megapolitana TaxID=420953 RepID=UPI0038BD5917
MRPVVFDGCFGWLHPAAGEQGVVLCNPFGYDALCTHRGWRKLAERLAAAGIPVLRFDYPGTGDSAGFEDDPQRVAAWIDSIVAATRRLREWTGVTRVSLVGLRLGATLAALAAQQAGDIDALVLLAPAMLGRNYLRELRAHRQSWLSTPAGMNADPLDERDSYVEAFGFGLHGDDIARLSEIDLQRDTLAPAARVLLLGSNDRSRAAALAAHYTQHGVEVERKDFDECDRFMIEALYSEEPVDAFGRVAGWLAQGASKHAPKHATHDHAVHADIPDEALLPLPTEAATERPIVFGPYFGIYCEPAAPRADAPAVLFFNTGASHHIGDGRIFVLFARQLAALGIASLRMDLGGLGDAQPAADTITLDSVYSEAACRDAMAGADWLVAHGHASVATFGVCGGAFVGLQVCARHPKVVGAFGVNLQKFVWDGAARTPGVHQFASSRVYWRAALTPGKWLRALRRQSHPLRVAAVLGRRIARRGWLAMSGWIEDRTGWPVALNEVRTLLRTIHTKGVQLRLVYGEFDVGLDEARVQFGPRLGGLRRYPRIGAVTLPKLDHALFTRPAREAAMADAQRWLCADVIGHTAPHTLLASRPGARTFQEGASTPGPSAAAPNWFDGVSP